MQFSSERSLPFLWWVKVVFIGLALVFGILFTVPTFVGNPAEWKRDKNGNPKLWYQKMVESVFPESRIALGLDLKGGLSLTLDVDINKSLEQAVHRAVMQAKETAKTKGIETQNVEINSKLDASVGITDPSKGKEFAKVVSDHTNLILFSRVENNRVVFSPNTLGVEEYKRETIKQALNTIRNRIDQFGVAEPSIFQQGLNRIIVELPGLKETGRAKQLIGNTAQLDFRLVKNAVPQAELFELMLEAKKTLQINENDETVESIRKISAYLREQKKIPEDSTILLSRAVKKNKRVADDEERDNVGFPYLVEANSRLTGELIENAYVQQTTENYIPEYGVGLKFKPQGAKIFGDLTKEAFDPNNAPHQIAIVLDENIQSAPVVNGPITAGNAFISMGRGGDTEDQFKSAQDLSLVLRAGALPASVKIIEERQIGPTEGAENIRLGVISTLIAAAIVILLMTLIYGGSGIIANIAMLFNVLLILAFLAAFGATLTLPGIAGIVLTMAIAVDGNVIINERIREEIRNGLSPSDAFFRGYNVSFKTLIDAHVTSALAGLVLLIFGNPAIKGFAITLIVGIISTLFTSYYVTEVIGQWLLNRTGLKKG